MFRTVPLSIIRSFSLNTRQWYMSYMFADSNSASSWFYYKNYHDAWSPECQMWLCLTDCSEGLIDAAGCRL